MTKNEKKWAENYELLKEYIAEHRQLPDRANWTRCERSC